MKKIILPTSIALLLVTGIVCADTKIPEQIKAEKVYQLKIDKVKQEMKKASDDLSQNYEKYGVFHPKMAEDYEMISEGYFTMGEFDHAIEYALRALKVEMKLLKEDDPKLAKLYFDTGNKYYMHKEHPTAILYMTKAAEIYKNSPEKESLALADTYEGIASTFINLEDYEKSLMYAEKCLAIRSKKLQKEDETLQRAQMNVDYLKGKLKK